MPLENSPDRLPEHLPEVAPEVAPEVSAPGDRPPPAAEVSNPTARAPAAFDPAASDPAASDPTASDPTASDPQASEATDPTAPEATGPDGDRWGHVSVLAEAAIAWLAVRPGGRYLDATLGAGGHAARLLAAAPETRVLGLDRDGRALAVARERLAPWGDRAEFWAGNFAEFDPGDRRFDGILADLGVSSLQIDAADRGFSFRQDAPLDMRMDRSQAQTAADIVNHWDETDLANALYLYGEERLSRRIARQIARQRPFRSTVELAEAIAACVPRSYRYGRIHPATRTFQALRIVTNGELDALETFLDRAPGWLVPGGRLAVISFHSLEDRRVKHGLRGDDRLTVLTKKPVVPEEPERQANPRARSAKLRAACRKDPTP